MIPFSDSQRAYDPGTLRIMADAFDRACCFLPATLRDNASARKQLALHIIHRVDEGELDSTRLAERAALSVMR